MVYVQEGRQHDQGSNNACVHATQQVHVQQAKEYIWPRQKTMSTHMHANKGRTTASGLDDQRRQVSSSCSRCCSCVYDQCARRSSAVCLQLSAGCQLTAVAVTDWSCNLWLTCMVDVCQTICCEQVHHDAVKSGLACRVLTILEYCRDPSKR